jgi:predicted RNase H-like HicB family nuclease
MATKKEIKKDLQYYLNLPWTFTIEQRHDEDAKKMYIIYVNELPGVCTDASTIQEAAELITDAMTGAFKLYMKHGDPIPEPIREEDFKGKISYRTSSKRHYLIAKEAERKHVSLSQAIDNLIDSALVRSN